MDNLREKIGFKEKVSYGLGDVACGLVYVLSCTFVAFFYTDGIGLNPAIVGSIIMFSRLFDGISDIAAGYIVDKTKSKHGKARAWILRTAIPIAACLVLTFTVPDGNGVWTYVYVAITYNLVNSVCYTMVNIPYGTLNSLMTRNQDQRMVINTFRMTMAQVGAMITNMITLPLVNAFGGSSSKKSWVIVATIYAVIAAVMLLVCFYNTKERVSADEESKKENISLLKAFKVAMKNQYWIILVIVEVVMIFGAAMAGAGGTYYAKYILGNENIIGVFSAINYAPAFILIPCLPKISAKIGKRNIALAGGILGVIGQILTLLNPVALGWLIFCSLIKGIGSVMIMGTVFAMVADTIEYGHWKTGERVEGVLYSATSFGTKVGGGVGAAVSMGILGAAGYDGLAATQTAEAINAIKNLYLYVPMAVLGLLPILFYMYKLDKIFPQVMEELLQREKSKNN